MMTKNLEAKIKAIIFDIGDVLYKESMKSAYSELSEIFGITLEEFNNIKSKYYDLAHTGKISALRYPRLIAEGLKIKDKDKFLKLWIKFGNKSLKLNRDVMKTILSLRKKYIIGTLTNITKLHDNLRIKKKVYNYFDIKLVSCREGLKKPDIRFYNLLLERLNFPAEQIVYIDDQEKYLEPAKKLGIKTILFKNNNQLIHDLEKFGINDLK